MDEKREIINDDLERIVAIASPSSTARPPFALTPQGLRSVISAPLTNRPRYVQFNSEQILELWLLKMFLCPESHPPVLSHRISSFNCDRTDPIDLEFFSESLGSWKIDLGGRKLTYG